MCIKFLKLISLNRFCFQIPDKSSLEILLRRLAALSGIKRNILFILLNANRFESSSWVNFYQYTSLPTGSWDRTESLERESSFPTKKQDRDGNKTQFIIYRIMEISHKFI